VKLTFVNGFFLELTHLCCCVPFAYFFSARSTFYIVRDFIVLFVGMTC
jgi:hypothetical protein